MTAYDIGALRRAWPGIVDRAERDTGADCRRYRACVFHDQGYVPSRKNLRVQNPIFMTFPDLEARPWWSVSDFKAPYRVHFEMLAALRQTFLSEFQSHSPRVDFGVKGETGYYGANAGWRIFVFLNEASQEVAEAVRLFPQTARILRAMRADNLIAKSHFSVLRPGAFIPVHCGAVNYELRLHYGLDIPEGDIGMKVGGAARPWQEGALSIFDDTFPHEVWNNTDQDRVILHCRLLHPDLSSEERRAFYRINDLINAALRMAKAV